MAKFLNAIIKIALIAVPNVIVKIVLLVVVFNANIINPKRLFNSLEQIG